MRDLELAVRSFVHCIDRDWIGDDMSDEKLRLGGMALRNGLALFGPTSWAAAVRGPDGGIQVATRHAAARCTAADRVPLAARRRAHVRDARARCR